MSKNNNLIKNLVVGAHFGSSCLNIFQIRGFFAFYGLSCKGFIINNRNISVRSISNNSCSTINLNYIVKDIIVGNILGDASINFKGNNKSKIVYNYANEEYINFVFNKLTNFTNYESISTAKNKDSRYNDKIRASYRFSTINNYEIFEISKHFLQPYIIFNENLVILQTRIENITSSMINEKNIKFKKILPSYEILHELIRPVSLAFWIMDDGQAVLKGGLTLCTDNFSKEEVLRLRAILINKFKLSCTIHEKKSKDKSRIYYRIYISKKSLPLLQSLISEFMLPSMMYKINLDVPLKKEESLSQSNNAIKHIEYRKRIRDWKKEHGADSIPPKKERILSTNPRAVAARLKRAEHLFQNKIGKPKLFHTSSYVRSKYDYKKIFGEFTGIFNRNWKSKQAKLNSAQAELNQNFEESTNNLTPKLEQEGISEAQRELTITDLFLINKNLKYGVEGTREFDEIDPLFLVDLVLNVKKGNSTGISTRTKLSDLLEDILNFPDIRADALNKANENFGMEGRELLESIFVVLERHSANLNLNRTDMAGVEVVENLDLRQDLLTIKSNYKLSPRLRDLMIEHRNLRYFPEETPSSEPEDLRRINPDLELVSKLKEKKPDEFIPALWDSWDRTWSKRNKLNPFEKKDTPLEAEDILESTLFLKDPDTKKKKSLFSFSIFNFKNLRNKLKKNEEDKGDKDDGSDKGGGFDGDGGGE